MSGDMSHGGENGCHGTSNPGFDPLSVDDLHSSTTNNSHGGDHHQLTDWTKVANESYEGYLSMCPGAHGGYPPLPIGSGNAAGKHDPPNHHHDDGNCSSDTYEEHIRPQEPSDNKGQYLRYVFHLYVDEDVESVKIVTEKPMLSGSLTMSLDRCLDDRKHWRSYPLFIHPNDQDTFRYRYAVKYKEGMVKAFTAFVFNTFTGKKEEKAVQEIRARKLNNGMQQFDIFHNPNEHSPMRNVFLGQMFFIKRLYQELNNGGDLKYFLIECEHIGFGHPGYTVEDVKRFLKWVEDVIGKCRTPCQGVYICSLLGQLVDRGRNWSAGYTCRYLGQKVADLLLSSLGCCPCTELPQSSTKFIKVVAEDLFNWGSTTGCLLFIQYFCNLLDVNYVMQVVDKRSSQTYTEQQFGQHVPILLDSLKRLTDHTSCTRYLSYVIGCSPTGKCLWNLYEIMSRCFPALVESLTKEFSSVYCKFISRSRRRKPDLLDPLFWCQVPENLKEKLGNEFCKALANQVLSETTWSKERLASLQAIATDARLYSSDQFRYFILDVITHKCKEVVSILPDLLESMTYCSYWKTNISDKEKEKVCHHWLRTYFCESGTKPKDKVLGVVEACESLCTTDALKTNKALCEAMEKEVERLVFQTSLEAIMSAFKDGQNRSPSIQQRLTFLLRSAIKQHFGTGDRQSKYKQMIRMLGYDVSKKGKEDLIKAKLERAEEEVLLAMLDLIPMSIDQGQAQMFKAMMSTSEVWLPVLSALHPHSTLMEHPKVVAATDVLQQLTVPLLRYQLPVAFFLGLKDEELRLLATFCALASSLESKGEQHSIDDWRMQLSKERETAQTFCERFSKLEKTICLLKVVSKDIVVVSDAKPLIREINKRKKAKTTTTLKDVVDVNYWGSLHSLIHHEEATTRLQGSVLFTNFARMCLTEELATSQSVVEEAIDIPEILPESKEETNTERTAAEILCLLESKGLHQFKGVCTNLFDTSKDLSVKEVNMLFDGINNEDALQLELKVISSFFAASIPTQKEKMLTNYLHFPFIRVKVEQLMSVFAALGYDEAKDAAVTKDLHNVMSCSHTSEITLARLSEVVENKSVATVDRKLDHTLTTIITILQESSELISFMKETAGEDIRILIDAVEEHSDQFVSEAIVSDLIDVHGFLRNVLRETPKDPLMFLVSLEKCYSKLEKKGEMAAKIKECGCNVHSLRGLYMNVANRGEMTKEIISNALQKGCYLIKSNPDGSCDVQLSYCREEGASKVTSYNMAELHDLRSRALLIVNTDKKQETMKQSNDCDATFSSVSMTLSAFTQQVEMITDILNMVMLLRESGHPQFETFWHKLNSSEEIETLANSLETKLKQWENILRVLQKEHYFLNFFHPDQLWILKKFFSRPLPKNKEGLSLKKIVHSLLRFVDPSICHGDLDDFCCLYKAPKENLGQEGDLRAIGKVLDAIFIPRQSKKLQKVQQHDLQRAIKPGELFVAVLEQNSKQTAHVVMSLFESTTGSYPQPSQVLFCHSDTSWEEVERLLKRAFQAHSTAVTLHCLANVENLSNDMQFELVAAIRAFQQNAIGPYLLSIVCCGGIHHHIADQFSSSAHNVIGMTEVQLRTTFKKDFPNVFMVTSDLPGVGKTEAIYEHAASQKNKIATIPISGPMSRKHLVKRLSSLQFGPYECIHFDVGEVDDPSVLDTLIFELVVVGMVSSGTDLFHLPTKHVYIEIANTLRHWLQDSLPVTKCFFPLRIKLDGYKDLVVSPEPLSAIQVVCQYLDAFESGKLESKDVRPGEEKPLPPNRCKVLLTKYFSSSGDLSYNIIESFIKVFANQLLQFSASPYFKPHNLRVVLGPLHDVRNCLFKALLEVSREFASRSVVTCKSVQSEAISKEQATEVLKKLQLQSKNVAEKMVERVEGMIQWADNNHLVIVFHSLEALTISALYRDLSLVPSNVHELFKTQAMKGKDMDDFTKMDQKQLLQRLDRIVRTTPRGKDDSLQNLDYALTPDNILKMVLIIQRIRAGIPVIVMGETGCGKTSLVRYLAKTCGVPFHVFNFHAGVSEEELVGFVQEMEIEAASGNEVWVFLDEINTCDYLGTINEMICHRSIKGKPLIPNLVFIAACNPYRLRPPGKITTAGLSGKTITDEYSKLVYRVHPLPETMIDFVWDYGSLSNKDERVYIGRMVEGITGNPNKLLVDLLCTSQEYIREVDKSPYCVSLRDAHRCIVLVKWFKETLQKRKELSLSKMNESREYHNVACWFSYRERSFVLALAHCYQSRLPTTESRKGYRKHIVDCFRKHQNVLFHEFSFEAIVRAEQEDYLERMELPEGTAKNAALRENVFVMLVCILNRIPVFVVGKPGCSKSLSMQIIRSNLRGKDAKDPFLKTLPQLYVVSHQGSESSTSDGILKVFEKARKYKEHNKTGDVLPVVLLDEIGLAEVSKYNPLKVLHSLLEPGDSAFPNVAVVGISNWSLDAAKMNRAIHLSRPEPDVDDLFETGKSLREANCHRDDFGVSLTRSGRQFRQEFYPDDKQLRCLAEAYQKYQVRQRYANFHGLRDYYSLIKCLSTDLKQDTTHISFSEEKTKGIQHALQRNFGGIPNDVNNFQNLFQEGLQMQEVMEETYHFPVTELICDNLHDKLARHLMIITNGDSAIGILDQTLQSLNKEKITIFGSRFEEDISEEYNYRMLSRIILCMERDCILILRDLESIYGSLYDMLNQNYTVVGGKRNCRVALGAFSNPMCQVHDGFRCVVLIDQERVDFTDPPFLNRFEKQLLRFSDVLNVEQRKIISILNDWVTGISTIPDFESQFREEDMFVGFCDDTLPSLVLKNRNSYEIVEQCKQDLMMVASPDGVVRSLQSAFAEMNLDEVQTLYINYFQKPLHNGFMDYLRHLLENLQLDSESKDATDGMRLVIMTHSNIHVNVSQCLDGLVQCQTEKLSAFKSEKQLTKELERFWRSSDSLLVLQCKPELDATHMLLAKSIIEQQREKHIKDAMETNEKQVKHVCIVIHVQRESEANKIQNQHWQFSFQSGWKQVTIDVLEKPVLPITECLDVSVMDLLESKTLSFEDVASNQFLWCFTRIKYPATHQPALDAILQLEHLLRSSSKILECFKELVKRWLTKRENVNSHRTDLPSWQYSVACDRQALINSSHLVGAIQHHVSHLIRQPLAKIVYFLEKESAWPQFLFIQDTFDEEELGVWLELILDQDILDIDDIPDPQGAESYYISERRLQLKFPCASVFYKKVEQVQPMFAEDRRRLLLDETNLEENEELHDVAAESQLHRFASVVKEKIPQVFELDYLQRNIECYVDDLLDMKSAHFSSVFTRTERIDFLKSAMAHHIKFPIDGDSGLLITRLHSLFWLKEPSFMAALQVYETCHKLANVDLDEILSEFTSLFEKMLFQDKNPPQNEVSEDSQVTERRRSCDNQHEEYVDSIVDNHESGTKQVIDENCTTENEAWSQQEKESEETKAVKEIGVEVIEEKRRVDKDHQFEKMLLQDKIPPQNEVSEDSQVTERRRSCDNQHEEYVDSIVDNHESGTKQVIDENCTTENEAWSQQEKESEETKAVKEIGVEVIEEKRRVDKDHQFEKMLLQDKIPPQNEVSEDSQVTERRRSCDNQHEEYVDSIVNNHEAGTKQVIDENCTTENEARSQQEKESEETKAVKEIGVEVIEGKRRVDKDHQFEKMLLQDKIPPQNEVSEDFQVTERRRSCDNQHEEYVDSIVDNHEAGTKQVIDENCTTENEAWSQQEKESEETKAVKEIGVEVIEEKRRVDKDHQKGSVTKQTEFTQTKDAEDQERQDKDKTKTVERDDSMQTKHGDEDVCADERVGESSLSVADGDEENKALERQEAVKQNLQGIGQNESDKVFTKDNSHSWRNEQDESLVEEHGNVAKSDETEEYGYNEEENHQCVHGNTQNVSEDDELGDEGQEMDESICAKENSKCVKGNTHENVSEDDEMGEEGQEIDELIVDGSEEASVSFDEVLVMTLCSALLPTDELVNALKGPDGWQRTTSLFLSTVSRMQVQIPAFYYLRVCYDFVTLLVLPEGLEPYSLYMLGALGKTGASEGYLDSPDIFDHISVVIDELKERVIEKRRLEDFLMLFYGRCIDSNPDTPVLGSILARICSSGETSLMRLAGPLVHRIFLTEEQFCPGVFEKLLHSLDTINEHPGLQEISASLSTLADDVELDCPFAVVCCDLISEVAFLKVDFTSLSSSEDQILLNFRKAFQTLADPCEDTENGVFHLLCATAYLKSFLAFFAKFILQRRQCLVEEGEFSMLLNEISAALSSSQADPVSSRASELQMYFLKELKKELYLYEVHEICQRSPKLPALKSLDWQDENLVGKLSFDPFQTFTENSQAQAALATLLEKHNPKPFEDAIDAMLKSAEERFKMAAVLTKSFYLVRSRRNLKDSEDKAIESFAGKILNMEIPYVQLLLRITGRKDFKGQKLCISPESSPADVHMATLMLHLCIILSSDFRSPTKEKLAFMSYFTNPMASNNSYVLASGESTQQPYKVRNNCSSERFGQTTSFFCSCGTVFVLAGDDDKETCPTCRSKCGREKIKSENEVAVEAIQPFKGYACLASSADISIHIRQLEPAEFRVLHLFVHAALYGGYALELFDEKCLFQILGSGLTESDPCQVCFQQIDSDLKALSSLLDAKEEDVIRFLHCALQESTSILTSAGLCPTEDKRMAWEKKFSETVRPLLREFYPRKLLARSHDFVSKSPFAVQRKIEEIDDPQFSDAEERNMHLPRLLRVTLPKTFTCLSAYYMAANDDTKKEHPLLGLFLDCNNRLPLVANLNHLLTWSRIVDSLLSRRLSRKETTKKIGDIIRSEAHSPEEKKRLSETFEKFTAAWEKMRPLVQKQLNQEVPYLSEGSPISFCLVEKRDQGVFLCAALEILRNIQNGFLRKMLSIAATGKCSALVFLEREEGKCSIPMVHLQEAREKEIIQYLWSDNILRHSQRNTEYGHGKEIFFDLAKIEKEMAVRFLVGKSFLSTFDGLHEFIFSRELFHTCRGILNELQELIPQQPLTDVFRSGLLRQRERSLKNVQDLLEHMEIVLCLLKRHQVGKPEEPLTEFTDKWLCGSRPFPKDLLPQPHSAIQLQHVVALYECLEDMLAESAAKRVHDMYRAVIPEEITLEMTKAAPASEKTEAERSALNAVTTALRRFIFRYLSSEEMRPEPGDSLLERMLEPSLWPIDAFKSLKSPMVESPEKFISGVFPEKLAIGQTYQVLCFYQDRFKVLEDAKRVSRSSSSKTSRPSVPRSRQLSRARFGYS